jgi:hypothetical protein
LFSRVAAKDVPNPNAATASSIVCLLVGSDSFGSSTDVDGSFVVIDDGVVDILFPLVVLMRNPLEQIMFIDDINNKPTFKLWQNFMLQMFQYLLTTTSCLLQ